MKIAESSYEYGWLKLKTERNEASAFLSKFSAGDYEIIKRKEKRSNNANSYAWLLMSKIASVMMISKEEVYTHIVENISGKTAVVSLTSCAKEDFKRAFIQGHIGRNVEIIGEHNGITDLIVTYGSSDYNVEQMSELLNSVIEECRALGIEYKSKDYIDKMLEEWADMQKS